MKKKTTLCLLLSLLAVSGGALSACGETASAPSEQTAPTENSAAVTEAVTEPAEYVSTGKDYGGETVTVSAVDYYTTGNRGVWRAQDYCEVFSNGENGDALNDGIYRRTVLVQEELNVKLALYSVDSFDNLVNEFRKPVMAGESVFDIAMMASNRLCRTPGSRSSLLICWSRIRRIRWFGVGRSSPVWLSSSGPMCIGASSMLCSLICLRAPEMCR